ncbi:MAG: nucleoside-diphosphate kinase, partial [Candidatus Aminicenantes bacterium]|nr:nucleoside-diphosphate kinase [Candidatus Aminicenantes bacterium]
MAEKTLAILKPDAVKKKAVGKILQRIEDEGFKISGMKQLHLTKEEAEGFYIIHKEKPFYG